MDKMQLLKSVIGTLGIYLIFSVFTVIFYLFLPYHGDLGIGGLANVSHMIFYYTVCLPLCGIAGALLFKGKIPVWLWTAATVLFTAAMTFITGGNTSDLLFNVAIVLPFTLIPFCIVKLCFYVCENAKKQ